MKKIWLAILFIVLVLGASAIFFSLKKPSNPSIQTPILLPTSVINIPHYNSGCDQSATTTDCVALEAMQAAATPTPSVSDKEFQLGYQNEKLGLMFTFPTKDIEEPKYWGDGSGDSFQATIPLASGGVIYAYATSKDFVSGKDGFPVPTEGFREKDGNYYAIVRGIVSNTPMHIDTVWTLADGRIAPVQFFKDDGSNSEYSITPMAAYINLPGPRFTGITFTLYGKDVGEPSKIDIEALKKIIASARVLGQ